MLHFLQRSGLTSCGGSRGQCSRFTKLLWLLLDYLSDNLLRGRGGLIQRWLLMR